MAKVEYFKKKRGPKKIAKIVIDQDTCIGCGTCVAITPEVFQLNKDGKSSVADPDGADDEKILSAKEACPVQAISLLDDEGGEVE